MLRAIGAFSPPIREMVEMQYEFTQPYLLDGAKFTRAFSFTPTPHRNALAETIAWFRARQAAKAGR
jgi:nucleoside-diphosphate-sugar epimerase